MEGDKRRAVFLDRDGTIIREVGYVDEPSKVELLPRSAGAIRSLNQAGFQVVVVTNQSGVARGYFNEEMVSKVHQRLMELLQKEGAHLDRIYYCPHHPEEGNSPYRKDCSCRKPKPGMLLEASRELNLDLSRSFMVSDKYSDLQMAHQLEVKGILVLTGYGEGELSQVFQRGNPPPDYVAEDLEDAAQWIIKAGVEK